MSDAGIHRQRRSHRARRFVVRRSALSGMRHQQRASRRKSHRAALALFELRAMLDTTPRPPRWCRPLDVCRMRYPRPTRMRCSPPTRRATHRARALIASVSIGDEPDRALTDHWEFLATVVQAQRLKCVQANCTADEALMLMSERARATDDRVVEIAAHVVAHRCGSTKRRSQTTALSGTLTRRSRP